jgi:hypothetical protein
VAPQHSAPSLVVEGEAWGSIVKEYVTWRVAAIVTAAETGAIEVATTIPKDATNIAAV